MTGPARGLPEDPILSLLAAELITNAILQARTPFTVTLSVAEGTAEIGVSDTAAGWPVRPSGGSSRAAHP